MRNYTDLDQLEAESIYIMREVAANFERPVLLYSVGKDSSCLLHLAHKAFYPAPIPFTFLHIDTTMKFKEMITFRDKMIKRYKLDLKVGTNTKAIENGMNPFSFGTSKCCQALKTDSLVKALAVGNYDAAIGGARRDEEKSRAKERIFSFRDEHGHWNPKQQRPELWDLFNPMLKPGSSMRVFPISNWTELDVWRYIARENIEIVPLYYAEKREMAKIGNMLIPTEHLHMNPKTQKVATVKIMCRYRTLGCTPCTGAIESNADTIEKIIAEVKEFRKTERSTRVIDHDRKGSMELKKREGYF